MQIEWIASFQDWLKDSQARLERENIRVETLGITSFAPGSIHVDFFGDGHEATVQLWGDGQSDFHLLDWEAAERDPQIGVVVTHYAFRSTAEMTTELEKLVDCLSMRDNKDKADAIPFPGTAYSVA